MVWFWRFRMENDKDSVLNSSEICRKFDITKNTLFKWEREGKISKVRKDWRGWRVFSDDNVAEIRRIIEEKARKNAAK